MAQLKDSGERRQFGTGAVRDIQEGKGRCDLMPLDVVCKMFDEERFVVEPLKHIAKFIEDGDPSHLIAALLSEAESYGTIENDKFKEHELGGEVADMLLNTSIHFEDGALKYGENNWQKGIPVHCYIDSAIRHYLKSIRGDEDEPHDRAFTWNLLCAAWTCEHIPELNDYLKGSKGK